MRVFKQHFKNRRGKRQATRDFYCEFRQGDRTRRIPAYPTKRASEELGRNLEALAAWPDDPKLAPWLATLPSRTRETLVRFGLLQAERVAASKPLVVHLADWHAALLAKGTSRLQADLVRGRAERLLTACKARTLPDVSADRVLSALADLRTGSEEKRPVSERTSNFYAGALVQFLRWAVRGRRLAENPLAGLTKLTVTDERKRRALLPDEGRQLVAVTARDDAPVRFGMSGAERALLYRVAIGSGFRASELAALTRASFDLSADPPTATLPATATKNRKPAVQPMTRELADAIRSHLTGKAPAARAFNVPNKQHTADMFRADLADARAAWLADAPSEAERTKRAESDFLRAETDAGRLDFHALRHTFGSDLARAGVSVKVAMDLMRHGDVNLTMRLYSHTVVADRGQAVQAALPDLSAPAPMRQRATGTDHARATDAIAPGGAGRGAGRDMADSAGFGYTPLDYRPPVDDAAETPGKSQNCPENQGRGEVSEWLKEPVSKTGVRVS